MTQDPNPKEALAAIRSARQGVPGDMKYPLSYDLLYGAACGLLVAGQALPTLWSLVCLAISLAGFGWMIQAWRKRQGWWINGYSPPRARWVAIGLGVALVGLMGLSIWGKTAGVAWTPLATGAAGFIVGILGGRLWMHVWKRELADGQG